MAGLVHQPAALAEHALAGHSVPHRCLHKREYRFIDLDQWALPRREDLEDDSY